MYGIIDIGSNTIRLVVYEVSDRSMNRVFNKKITAGLAGYISKDHEMTKKGVRTAVSALLELRKITDGIHLEATSVFATAPLRNINNTTEVIEQIEEETGFAIKVLDGKQEATYGFVGLRRNTSLEEGIMLDIGGGSTEVVSFYKNEALTACSIPWGSLNLYRKYVQNIMPSETELQEMDRKMRKQLNKVELPKRSYHLPLCVEGGTARAVQKVLTEKAPEALHDGRYGRKYLRRMLKFYQENPKGFTDMILKIAPERIHTILPGMVALNAAADVFDVKEIITVDYGVREGYLIREVLEKEKGDAKVSEGKKEK